MLLAAARRRYLQKRPPREGDEAALARGISAALRAEFAAADGLQALPGDARRRHVHYVHYRTDNATDRQPNQLTRKQLWAHLVRCYAEAYPRSDQPHRSILQFGVVALEKHHNAEDQRDRDAHHHAVVFCSDPHRWAQIRRLSAEKYNIQLNAVAHETYTTMYQYLRSPTDRKPLSELDPTPFFSPGHPKGDDLTELLRMGERFIGVRAQQRRGRKRGSPEVDGGDEAHGRAIRSQFGSVFQWVIDKGLRGERGAVQFHVDAVAELKAGRPHLLDFAKKYAEGLEDQLEFCWHVAEAWALSAGFDFAPPWPRRPLVPPGSARRPRPPQSPTRTLARRSSGSSASTRAASNSFSAQPATGRQSRCPARTAGATAAELTRRSWLTSRSIPPHSATGYSRLWSTAGRKGMPSCW